MEAKSRVLASLSETIMPCIVVKPRFQWTRMHCALVEPRFEPKAILSRLNCHRSFRRHGVQVSGKLCVA